MVIEDLLEAFPELERSYEVRGPGERYRSLKYAPCLLEFRDDGFYAVLPSRFIRQYSMFTRPRKRWEYHVLHIKDYQEPVYLGVIKRFSGAVSIERAVKNARPRTED